MKPQNQSDEPSPDIKVGPIALSAPAFLGVFVALSLMAFAVSGLYGVEPGTATSMIEYVLTKNVLWAICMLPITFGLAFFCKNPAHNFYRKGLPLVGLGLLAGSLISLSL